MVVSVHELTGFQRDLLYVIAGFDHPSGQRIANELEATLDTEITHGRLYPNLDTLVEKGLVEKGQISRRTNYYALTDDGAASLRARRAWEDDLYVPSSKAP
ncbi:PadR family transcriptional regulator [Halolamina litorea]|uniref:PadR family transcriptional regulator n=1 Tax=Halolamina litorea TaxID=1515593 RepID=A0ABD6BU51_9EURY|nr:PadR family transcriptional regulator [Halolamina litorea]